MGFSILNNVELVKSHFYEPGFIDLPDVVRIGRVNHEFYRKYFSDPNFRVWFLHNNLFTRQFKILRALSFSNIDGSETYHMHLSVIAKVQSVLGKVSKQIPLARLTPLEAQISNYASEYTHILKLYRSHEYIPLREAWNIPDELTRLLEYRAIFPKINDVNLSSVSAAFVWLVKSIARVHPKAVLETGVLARDLGLVTVHDFDELTKFLCPLMPDTAYAMYKMHYDIYNVLPGPIADFPDTSIALEMAASRWFENARNRCYKAIAQGLAKRDVELCRSTLDRITGTGTKNQAIIECIEEFLALNQMGNAFEFAGLISVDKEEAYEKIANYAIKTCNELPKSLLDCIHTARVISNLKMKLAIRIAPSDIDRALALIESIKDPACRVSAYLECITFVPSSKWNDIISGIDWNEDLRRSISFIRKIVMHDPRLALHIFMKINETNRMFWLKELFEIVVEIDLTIAEVLMSMFQRNSDKKDAQLHIDLWRQYPDVEKLCAFLNSDEVKKAGKRTAVINLIATLDIGRAIRELEVSDLHLLHKLVKIQAEKDPLQAMSTVNLLGYEDPLGLESIIVNEGVFANIPQALEVYNQITTPILKVQMLSVISGMLPTAHDYELIKKKLNFMGRIEYGT